MKRNDFIKDVYNEPVVNAVITKLRMIEYKYRRNDSFCHFSFMHIILNGAPIFLLSLDYAWTHDKVCICLLDSGEVINLKKFTSDLSKDLHLDDDYLGEKSYFQFSEKDLERICNDSRIQVIGYSKQLDNSRGTDVTTDPRVFRAYYALFIDETRFSNPFSGISPYFSSFLDRLMNDFEVLYYQYG